MARLGGMKESGNGTWGSGKDGDQLERAGPRTD